MILQKNCNIYIKDNKGRLPLHVLLENLAHSRVSEDKHEELLKLCSDDTSVNMQDGDGNAPLHIACKYKVLKAADFYFVSNLYCYSNKNSPNNEGYLPVHCAVSSCMPLGS